MSYKFVQIETDTYKGRNKTNETNKDNQILNAKCKYLESSRSSIDVDNYLSLMRDICPKPSSNM